MDSPDPDDHRPPARVREVYDEIAGHFSKTRAYPWPEIESFLADVPTRECGLDIGCGNGRHLVSLSEQIDRAVGVDASAALLVEARDRLKASEHVTLLQGDARNLPLEADSVDVGLYVATLHHLPDRETRRESLAELARVLTPDGHALVSAWSTTHDRFDIDASEDSDTGDTNLGFETAEGSGAEDTNLGFDTTVDWTLPDGETVPRFYHIYAPAEFEADLAASPLSVTETFVSSGNCFGHVRG